MKWSMIIAPELKGKDAGDVMLEDVLFGMLGSFAVVLVTLSSVKFLRRFFFSKGHVLRS